MLKIHAIFIFLFFTACQEAVKLDVVEREAPIHDNAQTIAYKPGSKVVVDNLNAESQDHSVPLIMLDPLKVCKDIAYYNKDGVLTQGERECDGAAVDESLQPQNIRAGIKIGSVVGTLVAADTVCSQDGETACVTTEAWPAVSTRNLAAKIIMGETVAGVSGTANATSFSNCSTDGGTACIATAAFPAAMASGLAAKIATGQSVAGVAGTAAVESHALCNADGGTACVVSLPYRAALTTGLGDKVLQGQSVAGVSGTVTLPAASLVLSGTTFGISGNSVTGILTLPLASNVRVSNGAFGVSGNSSTPTLGNCSSDGDVGCVVVGPGLAAAVTGGLAAKVLAGQNVAGVAGTAVGETHSDCTADGAMACVATASFKAVEISTLAPKVVTGQTVAGVAGSAAGETHSDCAADGATACVATPTFKAVEISTLAPKVITGQTVAGVAGSAASETHSDCTADGTTGCVATGSYTAAATLGLAPKILNGYRVAGVNGTATAESHVDCAADGSTGCVATTSYTAAATSALAPKIVTGFKVAGVDGTATAEYHNDCSADGTVGCVTTNLYKSADTSGLASKILFGQTVAGTSGNITLPSAGNVLSGISFGVSGNSALGTLTLPTVANVRVSNGTYGVAGTGSTPTLPDCSTNYAAGCVTTSSYRSADFTNITAGNIKNGVTLAGVTGAYPSASYPLAGNTATSDLTFATFNAKVKSAASFEWFDATGTLHTGAGDTDIAAANINGSVDIFGTTGSIANCTGDGQTGCLTTNTYKSVDTSTLSAWDLRYGKSAGGLTGQIRTTCQNKINSALFNHDGALTNSAVTTGTSNDPWDTVDNWNDNADALPSTSIAGTGAESTCNTSTNVWMDVTADGICDSGADDCVFYDRMTQLYWSESYPAPATAPTMTSSNWAFAVNRCDTLSFGGFTDWRMPTQNDMMTAILHSIRDLGYKGGTAATASNNSNFISAVDDHYFWTATSGSANTAYAWQYFMADGTAKVAQKTGSFSGAYNFTSICVRP